jgi:hypothetical protein
MVISTATRIDAFIVAEGYHARVSPLPETGERPTRGLIRDPATAKNSATTTRGVSWRIEVT